MSDTRGQRAPSAVAPPDVSQSQPENIALGQDFAGPAQIAVLPDALLLQSLRSRCAVFPARAPAGTAFFSGKCDGDKEQKEEEEDPALHLLEDIRQSWLDTPVQRCPF